MLSSLHVFLHKTDQIFYLLTSAVVLQPLSNLKAKLTAGAFSHFQHVNCCGTSGGEELISLLLSQCTMRFFHTIPLVSPKKNPAKAGFIPRTQPT